MTRPTLSERVTFVERKMEALDGLPAQVESLRADIRAVEEALRTDIRAVEEAVRTEFQQEIRSSLAGLRAEVTEEIRQSATAQRTELMAAIRDGDDETRRYMRVLHEEVLTRIATLREAHPGG